LKRLEDEVENQHEIYEATVSAGGDINEEYERKYANTMRYLNETIPESQRAIRSKIESYEQKIANLEHKIHMLINTREETQSTSVNIGQNVMEMENQRRNDGYVDDEADRVRLLEQGGEGLRVLMPNSADFSMDELTIQIAPQRTPSHESLETV
jgi:predicted RND superfamily exporter protein